MNKISKYSLNLINKISEAKEISYYELKKIFSKYETIVSEKCYNGFNIDEELEELEEKGIISQEEGLIIFEEA